MEAPQDVAAAEDFAMEPVGHVTNVGGDQGGGDSGLGGGAERFSPQEAHKEETKGKHQAFQIFDILIKGCDSN